LQVGLSALTQLTAFSVVIYFFAKIQLQKNCEVLQVRENFTPKMPSIASILSAQPLFVSTAKAFTPTNNYYRQRQTPKNNLG
jgi:hypothetical protein